MNLALRNCTRRRGRSMVIVALLGCASFLIIAVGANRHDPLAQANERWAGTGGFSLIGESSMSVFHDLNSLGGRKSLGLFQDDLDDVPPIGRKFARPRGDHKAVTDNKPNNISNGCGANPKIDR